MGITVIALGAQKKEVGSFILTTVLISRTNVKGLKQFYKNQCVWVFSLNPFQKIEKKNHKGRTLG